MNATFATLPGARAIAARRSSRAVGRSAEVRRPRPPPERARILHDQDPAESLNALWRANPTTVCIERRCALDNELVGSWRMRSLFERLGLVLANSTRSRPDVRRVLTFDVAASMLGPNLVANTNRTRLFGLLRCAYTLALSPHGLVWQVEFISSLLVRRQSILEGSTDGPRR
jgi:hypothetical protein